MTKMKTLLMTTICALSVTSTFMGTALAETKEPAQGDQVSSEQVFSAIGAETLHRIMKDEGYAVSIDKDGDILWKINGARTFFIVAKNNKSLSFQTGFSVDNVDMKALNKWNSTKRYSRTYLRGDNKVVIQSDLSLIGGVTEKRILNYIKICRTSLRMWSSEVLKSEI